MIFLNRSFSLGFGGLEQRIDWKGWTDVWNDSFDFSQIDNSINYNLANFSRCCQLFHFGHGQRISSLRWHNVVAIQCEHTRRIHSGHDHSMRGRFWRILLFFSNCLHLYRFMLVHCGIPRRHFNGHFSTGKFERWKVDGTLLQICWISCGRERVKCRRASVGSWNLIKMKMISSFQVNWRTQWHLWIYSIYNVSFWTGHCCQLSHRVPTSWVIMWIFYIEKICAAPSSFFLNSFSQWAVQIQSKYSCQYAWWCGLFLPFSSRVNLAKV